MLVADPAPAVAEAAGRPPRVALVTGAARRIGREIALGLAAAGYDIAVHYGQSKDDAERTVADIHAMGRRAVALQADLADPAACEALLEFARVALGHIDCLVNSAARFEFDDADGFTPAALERHLGPNLTAPILLAQQLYRACQRDKRPGVVINLLDQKLDNLNPDFFSYTLTKTALLGATRMMAMAFAPLLRVNGVSPGATLASWKQDDEQFAHANRIALLGRSSLPDDIVQAVCYLAEASAVTGVNLIVDGGQHLMALDRDVMFLTPKPPA
ncbi:MAG: SDR family oxidoreductase [Burkholderiaceae bacterium]